MYHLTEDALRLMTTEKAINLIKEIGEDTIVKVINEGRNAEAMEIVKNYVWPLLSNTTQKVLKDTLDYKEIDFKTEWNLSKEAA
jgi:hypothetical protein